MFFYLSVSMVARDIQHLCQRFRVQCFITILIQHGTKKSNYDFHSISPRNITFCFRLFTSLAICLRNVMLVPHLKILLAIVGKGKILYTNDLILLAMDITLSIPIGCWQKVKLTSKNNAYQLQQLYRPVIWPFSR